MSVLEVEINFSANKTLGVVFDLEVEVANGIHRKRLLGAVFHQTVALAARTEKQNVLGCFEPKSLFEEFVFDFLFLSQLSLAFVGVGHRRLRLRVSRVGGQLVVRVLLLNHVGNDAVLAVNL